MKPYHKNPRQIKQKRFDALTDTLDRLGDLGGIVHNQRTDEVIGGNQRTRVFSEASEVQLIEMYDKPDRQGTIAHGFIVWRGTKFSYRLVDWDEATCEEANIKANLGAGDWDWEKIADEWTDVTGFKDWFDADLLRDWGRDYSALADFLESEGDGEAGEGDGEAARQTLAERFIVPPFSVLDARQGYWQARKRAWIALGLKGEIGREESENPEERKWAKSKNSLVDFTERYNNDLTSGDAGRRIASVRTGISIFDPVLSELLYRWFMPIGGHVVNPMSGEATHGIVAGKLGYKFTGVELRPEQAESNAEQAAAIGIDAQWICSDAKLIDTLGIEPADFIVSYPPYADLEVYSDNPLDLSTMDYKDFIETYRVIVDKSCQLLKPNRFACFVVGEVRDKRGNYYNFVADTIQSFIDAGMSYYNEAILVTAVSSLPLRAGRAFSSGRKLGKTHQNVLVFVKGDWREAVKACGDVEVFIPDDISQDD